MTLQVLGINRLRNISEAKLELCSGLNVIYGQNGSGKTSILEAINILGTGKSFRSNQISKVIQSEQKELTLFGRIVDERGKDGRTGIRRSRTDTEVHVNGEKVQGLSELARMLPLVVVTPESHRLLDSGPQWRRRFLDWGVFHVEHSYSSLWSRFNQCIKQRNAALLSRSPVSVLSQWTSSLLELGLQLDELRRKHFLELLPYLEKYSDTFLPGSDIEFAYAQGWSKDLSLEQAFELSLDQDRANGRTMIGPQRAEIKVRFNGMNARESVSRGQQKLLVYAMHLAQTRCLFDRSGKKASLLLDDLGAELDSTKISILMNLINEEFSQVIITSAVEGSIPAEDFSVSKVFHVEHGNVITN